MKWSKHFVFIAIREDTVSGPCKNDGLRFKLDICLLIKKFKEIVDTMTGEVGKRATRSKIYKDKLKSVLAA